MTNHSVTDGNRVDWRDSRDTFEDVQPVHSLKEDEPLTDLLETYIDLLDSIDEDIERIFEGRFIDTATGEELEMLGANVGIKRKTGESEEKLRKRVKAGYRAARSQGTYEDIGDIALMVLDAAPSEVSLFPARETTDHATAIVEVHGTVINDSPFTESEIESILRQSAVGGHRVVLQRSNVFTWGDPENGWGTPWGKYVE